MKTHRFLVVSFALFELVIGISAVIGGYGLIATNGLGMPLSWLSGSPFISFMVPGILLTGLGLVYCLAAVLLVKNSPFALEGVAVCGFGMLIWIFTQQYIIKQSSPLQVLYFGLGILSLSFVFILMKYLREY